MSSSSDNKNQILKYENAFDTSKMLVDISNGALTDGLLSFSLFAIYPSIMYPSIRYHSVNYLSIKQPSTHLNFCQIILQTLSFTSFGLPNSQSSIQLVVHAVSILYSQSSRQLSFHAVNLPYSYSFMHSGPYLGFEFSFRFFTCPNLDVRNNPRATRQLSGLPLHLSYRGRVSLLVRSKPNLTNQLTMQHSDIFQ